MYYYWYMFNVLTKFKKVRYFQGPPYPKIPGGSCSPSLSARLLTMKAYQLNAVMWYTILRVDVILMIACISWPLTNCKSKYNPHRDAAWKCEFSVRTGGALKISVMRHKLTKICASSGRKPHLLTRGPLFLMTASSFFFYNQTTAACDGVETQRENFLCVLQEKPHQIE